MQVVEHAFERVWERASMGDVKVDQVGDDFGVCLAFEDVSFFFERKAEQFMILDDAVVNDRDGSCFVGVWVRVLDRDFSVCCPSCVANHGAAWKFKAFCVFDVAYLFEEGDASLRERGKAPGVVAAVAESFESVMDEGSCVFCSVISEYAAHVSLYLFDFWHAARYINGY